MASGYRRVLLRQAAESRHRATHDSLTGLPNRALLNQRLQEAVDREPETSTTVIVLDLDRFQEVNDTLGHACGDELLRQLAERARGVFRDSDLVAHLSGDEFAILLGNTGEQDGLALAERLIAEVNRSFVIEGIAVDVEASVGLAVSPQHGRTGDALHPVRGMISPADFIPVGFFFGQPMPAADLAAWKHAHAAASHRPTPV